MKKMGFIALSLLAVILVLSATAFAQGAPTIPWSVVGGGGGHAESGVVALDSAIGQWAASGGSQISSGFLPGSAPAPAVRQLRYLPLALRR
jgi:hypothetical protein